MLFRIVATLPRNGPPYQKTPTAQWKSSMTPRRIHKWQWTAWRHRWNWQTFVQQTRFTEWMRPPWSKIVANREVFQRKICSVSGKNFCGGKTFIVQEQHSAKLSIIPAVKHGGGRIITWALPFQLLRRSPVSSHIYQNVQLMSGWFPARWIFLEAGTSRTEVKSILSLRVLLFC